MEYYCRPPLTSCWRPEDPHIFIQDPIFSLGSPHLRFLLRPPPFSLGLYRFLLETTHIFVGTPYFSCRPPHFRLRSAPASGVMVVFLIINLVQSFTTSNSIYNFDTEINTRIPENKDTWKPGYLETRMPGIQNTWKPEYLETRIPVNWDIWKPGYLETRIPGN